MVNLLDLTVRELLDSYGLMYSPECNYVYGVIPYTLADKMYDEYDLEDCMSVAVDSLIDFESEIDFDVQIDENNLKNIMDTLGIEYK